MRAVKSKKKKKRGTTRTTSKTPPWPRLLILPAAAEKASSSLITRTGGDGIKLLGASIQRTAPRGLVDDNNDDRLVQRAHFKFEGRLEHISRLPVRSNEIIEKDPTAVQTRIFPTGKHSRGSCCCKLLAVINSSENISRDAMSSAF